MILLDENITRDQQDLLIKWRFSVRKIGLDIILKGRLDEQVITYLQNYPTTLFTRDMGFFQPKYLHAQYSIAVLAVNKEEAAYYTRKFMQHPASNTFAKRKGKIFQLSHDFISCYVKGSHETLQILWE